MIGGAATVATIVAFAATEYQWVGWLAIGALLVLIAILVQAFRTMHGALNGAREDFRSERTRLAERAENLEGEVRGWHRIHAEDQGRIQDMQAEISRLLADRLPGYTGGQAQVAESAGPPSVRFKAFGRVIEPEPDDPNQQHLPLDPEDTPKP
ncbi:MAG: hypothetical protein ACLP9C_10645 [Acidimicrobiales bacterium]